MYSPKVSAHRGLTSKFEENTVASIKAAEDMGVDIVEFDVQRSQDDVWFLHHDLFIVSEDNLIKEMPFDEINEIAKENGIQLDLFEDVLSEVREVELNIECKSESYEDGVALAQFLRETPPQQEYNISSFSRDTLQGLYDQNSHLKLSYLGYLMPFFRWQLFNRKVPLYSINPYKAFLFGWKVKSAHKRDIQVHTWTVNSEEKIKKCFELGVDVIITDKPDRVMKMRLEYFTN